MVELATVVYCKDANHNAKCKAKQMPEHTKTVQAFDWSRCNSLRLFQTIGSSNTLAKYILYILITVGGASDHFTKIAENDIAIIEMANSNSICYFFFCSSFHILFSCCRLLYAKDPLVYDRMSAHFY